MPAKLLHSDATGLRGTPHLPASGAVLGRTRDSIIPVKDESVDERHSWLVFEQGQWIITDLSSSTGTFVNEERIQRQTLHHRDVIRCGKLSVQFVEDPPPRRPVTADEVTIELAKARLTIERLVKERYEETAKAGTLEQRLVQSEQARSSLEYDNRFLREQIQKVRSDLTAATRLAEQRDAEIKNMAVRHATERETAAELLKRTQNENQSLQSQLDLRDRQLIAEQQISRDAKLAVEILQRGRLKMTLEMEGKQQEVATLLNANKELDSEAVNLRTFLNQARQLAEARGTALQLMEAELRPLRELLQGQRNRV